MRFINRFKNIKKMGINMYSDIENSWAEYEYICITLKNEIVNLIQERSKDLNDVYIDVQIKDAVITVIVKPGLSISLIEDIKKIIGIDGCVSAIGQKKNSGVKITFYRNEIREVE